MADELRRRGIEYVIDAVEYRGVETDAASLRWTDYSDVDLVLAVRPPIGTYTDKPASKLYNAWRAGVPALLGPEPAFRELYTDPLDYVEVSTVEDALAAIDRLRAEPDLYRRMIDRGRRRGAGVLARGRARAVGGRAVGAHPGPRRRSAVGLVPGLGPPRAAQSRADDRRATFQVASRRMNDAARLPPPRALDVERIRDRLGRRDALRIDGAGDPFAAVAMILAGGPHDPTILFIERAKRIGDPWSGHMAFPGGRVEQDDADSRRTAERETFEEVGIDLSSAELIGRLDDQAGRRAGTTWQGRPIAGYVYHLTEPAEVVASPEVEEALWVRSSALFEPRNQVDYTVSYAPGTFPGILVGKPDRHVIWGLTYRFLESFMRALDETFP